MVLSFNTFVWTFKWGPQMKSSAFQFQMKSINMWPFKWKPPSTTPVVLFVMLYKLVRDFESVDELWMWLVVKWKSLIGIFLYYSVLWVEVRTSGFFMKSRCNSKASPIQVHCLNTPRCRGFTYYKEPCIQYTWYNRNMNSIMNRFTY